MDQLTQELTALRRAFEAQQATLTTLAQVMGTRLNREQLMARRGIKSRTTLAALIERGIVPRPGPDGKWLLADLMDAEAREKL